MAQPYRTWVEISRDALRHNLATFQRAVGPTVGILPIVKSNAYGHGLVEVVTALQKTKIAGFGVAYGQEALALRSKNYRGRLIVLSFWHPDELPELLVKNVELAVWDWSSLDAIFGATTRTTRLPRIHLKLDTGTSRIGFQPREIQRLQKKIQDWKNLKVVGVFSHLANSEERPAARTRAQIQRFIELESHLALKAEITRHLACTASIMRYPEARFGLVRLGIGLYGLWPSSQIRAWSRAYLPKIHLAPAMVWKSNISQVKRVTRGTAVGYGGTWVARKNSVIATLPVGYGDGYPRVRSNRSWVMIRGHRAPVVGRIAMNLLTVDATKVPGLSVRDTATLLGPGIDAERLAEQTQTINYEVTTIIHPTIPRVLV